jgi:hypothetical protein
VDLQQVPGSALPFGIDHILNSDHHNQITFRNHINQASDLVRDRLRGFAPF